MKEEDKIPSIFAIHKWFKFWRETRHATKDIQTDAVTFYNITDKEDIKEVRELQDKMRNDDLTLEDVAKLGNDWKKIRDE